MEEPTEEQKKAFYELVEADKRELRDNGITFTPMVPGVHVIYEAPPIFCDRPISKSEKTDRDSVIIPFPIPKDTPIAPVIPPPVIPTPVISPTVYVPFPAIPKSTGIPDPLYLIGGILILIGVIYYVKNK